MTTPPSPEDDIFFATHWVLLFDVLGQDAALHSMEQAVHNNASRDSIIPLARASIGRVLSLRDYAEHVFRNTFSRMTTIPEAEPQPDHLVAAWTSFAGNDLGFMQFSDTLVFYDLLFLKNGTVRTPSLIAALVSAATIFAMCMLQDVPIRGGIDVGHAARLDRGDLYGPALSRAYHAESCVAAWPRIVVGQNLLDFAAYCRNPPGAGIGTLFFRAAAQMFDDYTCVAEDGTTMVHWLTGETLADISDDPPESTLARIRQNIYRQQQSAIAMHNQRLVDRYAALDRYIERYAAKAITKCGTSS